MSDDIKSAQRTALYGFVLRPIAAAVIIVGDLLTGKRLLDRDRLSGAGRLVVAPGTRSGVSGGY